MVLPPGLPPARSAGSCAAGLVRAAAAVAAGGADGGGEKSRGRAGETEARPRHRIQAEEGLAA